MSAVSPSSSTNSPVLFLNGTILFLTLSFPLMYLKKVLLLCLIFLVMSFSYCLLADQVIFLTSLCLLLHLCESDRIFVTLYLLLPLHLTGIYLRCTRHLCTFKVAHFSNGDRPLVNFTQSKTPKSILITSKFPSENSTTSHHRPKLHISTIELHRPVYSSPIIVPRHCGRLSTCSPTSTILGQLLKKKSNTAHILLGFSTNLVKKQSWNRMKTKSSSALSLFLEPIYPRQVKITTIKTLPHHVPF